MVVVVFGLPGTGKSYLCKHLLKEMDAAYLNTDKIRSELKLQKYDEETKQKVYNNLLDRMGEEVGKGKDVLIDGTFYQKSKRDDVVQRAGTLNQEVCFIELKTFSDETIKERVTKNRPFSEADYKIYMQIKSQFEPPERPHLKLWTDSGPIETMVEKTKNYINGQETG